MLPFLTTRALTRAFTRVKENHGCAGADGVSLEEFQGKLEANLEGLRQEVESGAYFAWPLRRILIEKQPGSAKGLPGTTISRPNSGTEVPRKLKLAPLGSAEAPQGVRTLLVPAVRDRVLQTAVAAYLEPLLEPEFEECSFAYRRGRSVRMAVERVYGLFHEGYTWLVDADIEDFFTSVQHSVALARLAPLVPEETVLRLVKLWLDYTVWDGLHLTRPGIGLPQGAVVSPMLANLCLDSMDDELLAAGFKLVRYADDFVILTKSRKAAERAYQLTEEALARLRLRLHEGKTRITRSSDPFRFLGVIFMKDLLLQPFRTGRKRLAIVSMARMMPEHFFPDSERRPLRRYRGW